MTIDNQKYYCVFIILFQYFFIIIKQFKFNADLYAHGANLNFYHFNSRVSRTENPVKVNRKINSLLTFYLFVVDLSISNEV